MPDLHKKIIAVRKKRNLSQSQAAELANIPIRTYQSVYSGLPDPPVPISSAPPVPEI